MLSDKAPNNVQKEVVRRGWKITSHPPTHTQSTGCSTTAPGVAREGKNTSSNHSNKKNNNNINRNCCSNNNSNSNKSNEINNNVNKSCCPSYFI